MKTFQFLWQHQSKYSFANHLFYNWYTTYEYYKKIDEIVMQDLNMIGTRKKKFKTYLLDLPTETKRKKKKVFLFKLIAKKKKN